MKLDLYGSHVKTLEVGETISVSVNGDNPTEIYLSTIPGNQPERFRLIDNLSNENKTYGPYAYIAKVQVLANGNDVDIDTVVSPSGGAGVSNSEVLIPFGDSLVARFWKQLGLTGNITVSGNVATVTTSINHLAPIGSRIRIGLSSYSGFNGVFTITATPFANQVSFAAPADAPVSVAAGSAVIYFESDQNFSTEFIQYLKIFSKHRFSIPYNGGLGGDDTDEALVRFEQENIIGMNPGRILIMLGTNDYINATSQDASQALANLTNIYNQCLSAGIAVDACTVPPLGSGHASVSDVTKAGFLMNLNKGIRDFVRVTPGMRLHDVYQWVTDPAQANGQARANYLVDTVHFAITGAWNVGKNMADNYASWIGAHPDKLPVSQADGWTFNTSSKNRFANHLMQGAGPIAPGWTILYTGGTKTDSTVARTLVKDGDVFGQNQKSILNGTAGTHLVYQEPHLRLTAGKTYVVRASVTISKDTFTSMLTEISVGFTVDGIARTIRAGIANVIDSAGTFQIETPPFIWPASYTGIPLFYLRSVPAGTSAAGFIEWGRVELEQVD
jgi:hypothetical protein